MPLLCHVSRVVSSGWKAEVRGVVRKSKDFRIRASVAEPDIMETARPRPQGRSKFFFKARKCFRYCENCSRDMFPHAFGTQRIYKPPVFSAYNCKTLGRRPKSGSGHHPRPHEGPNGIKCRKRRQRRCALTQLEQPGSARQRGQPGGFDRLLRPTSAVAHC
jgi:hypothetical protein